MCDSAAIYQFQMRLYHFEANLNAIREVQEPAIFIGPAISSSYFVRSVSFPFSFGLKRLSSKDTVLIPQ